MLFAFTSLRTRRPKPIAIPMYKLFHEHRHTINIYLTRAKQRSHYILMLLLSWGFFLIIYFLYNNSALIAKLEHDLHDLSQLHHEYLTHDHHQMTELEREHVIFTNIGIVIPSYVNEYTLSYLDRLLCNVYLSQMDMQPEFGIDRENEYVYYPSEVIISMSIMPPFYAYKSNLTQIIHYYISNHLNHDKSRLRIIYHHNKTMNAAQNRNFGISQINDTRSKYIALFDIDDIMHPQRIAVLHHVLNANDEDIDLLFHSFIMHKTCRLREIFLNYLTGFNMFNARYLEEEKLKLLATPVSNQRVYRKNYCVAQYRPKAQSKRTAKKAAKRLRFNAFQIECDNEAKKKSLIKIKDQATEFLMFDRFIHSELEHIAFVNYSQLIENRCVKQKKAKVNHNIAGNTYEVDCDYGTMAAGLEAFRNENAFTRHHNGWPTLKTRIAKQLKYDEQWTLHGSYRGQDSAFNIDVHRHGYHVFHMNYYLGMYCYH